jgi:hypothetical protein
LAFSTNSFHLGRYFSRYCLVDLCRVQFMTDVWIADRTILVACK